MSGAMETVAAQQCGAAGLVATLNRHARINDDMGRVVQGQTDALRKAAPLIQSLSAGWAADKARIAALEAILARVPGALNGAFMAGSEEREGGSARRQERYAAEADALRVEIPAILNGERKG